MDPNKKKLFLTRGNSGCDKVDRNTSNGDYKSNSYIFYF